VKLLIPVLAVAGLAAIFLLRPKPALVVAPEVPVKKKKKVKGAAAKKLAKVAAKAAAKYAAKEGASAAASAI